MANILDYMDWRGDLTFEQSAFNEVDNLILAQLSYVNFNGIIGSPESGEEITVKEANSIFFEKYSEEEILERVSFIKHSAFVLKKMSECPRFSALKLRGYVDKIDYEEESQFSAMVIEIDEYTDYIAYRGTDDTIVGWKEDFNMTFIVPVPAQLEAVAYLENVGRGNKELIIGGHSKGGNLAVYAAVKCNPLIKSHIISVYNNDGPGFGTKITEDNDYKDIIDIVNTIVPQSSVVGILLEHEEDYSVVKSSQIGVFQHDALSWEVLGTSFVYLEKLTASSKRLDTAMKSWLNGLNKKQREDFVEALFGIFENADAKTVSDIFTEKWTVLKSFKNLDEETKKMLLKTVSGLIAESNKMLKTEIIERSPFKRGEE